jgi:hypothetical protein
MPKPELHVDDEPTCGTCGDNIDYSKVTERKKGGKLIEWQHMDKSWRPVDKEYDHEPTPHDGRTGDEESERIARAIDLMLQNNKD